MTRLRRTAQILIEEIGASGPEDAEETAARAVQLIRRLRGDDDWQGRCYTCAHWQGDRNEQRRLIGLATMVGAGGPNSMPQTMHYGSCDEAPFNGVEPYPDPTEFGFECGLVFVANFGCVHWTEVE